MQVSIIGCRCLKGKVNLFRDMLVAEGFDVVLQWVRKPGHLRVMTGGKTIWSWRLFRQVPHQRDLADMVRAANGV